MTDLDQTKSEAGRDVTVPIDGDHDLHHVLDTFGVSATNPLREGLMQVATAPPCVMVIFGVSGDLTSRKLMPALYDLAMTSRLAEGFTVIGVSRRPWTDEMFRAEMRKAIEENAHMPVTEERWESFAQGLFYVPGNFDDEEMYVPLGERLEAVDRERRTEGNRLFYLATPPSFYITIIQSLGRHALVERQDFYSQPTVGWMRLVVEKPIGKDLDSAPGHSITPCLKSCQKARSIGSTITLARKPSRT